MHICVCVCTYLRPTELKRLLTALTHQETKGLFSYSIVVADNDDQRSAQGVVRDLATMSPTDVIYCVEPRRSIALARNMSIEHAKGEAIAFIDDDEIPPCDWLFTLFKARIDYRAAAVLGPVRPQFDTKPPAWLLKSRLCDRPEHPSGFVISWTEGRTGNALIDMKCINGFSEVFRSCFNIGGSDADLFYRIIKNGHKVVWCNEAVVYEAVPPHHWNRSYLIKRALLRGRNTQMDPEGRFVNNLKALVTIPAYCAALPFLQLFGHHLFMRYLIKLCDHIGLLLALLRVYPVQERDT